MHYSEGRTSHCCPHARRPIIAGPTFFLSAAEHSGDALGASVIAALRRRFPEAHFVGVGGPLMAAAGCRLLANPVARSAMLLGAVFSQSRYWYKLLKQIRRELDTVRPAVVIPIDSSMVNLRVARLARELKLPVCYYVAPQLWASRPWRMGLLRARINTLCCVLPFEEQYFRKNGVNAVYVGHPMFDMPADLPSTDPARLDPPLPGIADSGERRPGDALNFTDIAREGPRVAIFPGSRKAEIDANLPPMLEVLSEIKGRFPRVSFVAAAPSEDRAWQIRGLLRRGNTPVDIRANCTDAIIRWADLCLTKSGTATLQIARHQKPMVVMFAVAAWKWHLAGRFLINTKYIALVNILADRALVPEFVPFYGSPLPIAREMIDLLSRPERRRTVSQELGELVRPLQPTPGGPLAADRVAAEVAKLASITPPAPQPAK